MKAKNHKRSFATLDQGSDADYQRHDFANRSEYLDSLCDDYDYETVYTCAELLGPSEDFDGLLSCLSES
jgi:hypothetical protein